MFNALHLKGMSLAAYIVHAYIPVDEVYLSGIRESHDMRDHVTGDMTLTCMNSSLSPW